MKKNVGNIDRILRLAVAVVIAVLFAMGKLTLASTLGIVLLVVAMIFAFTGLVGWCAIYALVGLSTCPVETSKS